MTARIIALPKRPKKRGRKPTKPPSCPVYDLASYRPAISPEVLYHRAHQLDENRETWHIAERLYRQAIELKPDYAIAMTNLGNVCFRMRRASEAEDWYRKAIALNPDQYEAWYNLGYMALESGDAERSITLFERAISAYPSFSDAYYNLAMALEQCGQPDAAQPHWRAFVKLEPTGTWSEIAKRHIDEDWQPPQPKLRLVQ